MSIGLEKNNTKLAPTFSKEMTIVIHDPHVEESESFDEFIKKASINECMSTKSYSLMEVMSRCTKISPLGGMIMGKRSDYCKTGNNDSKDDDSKDNDIKDDDSKDNDIKDNDSKDNDIKDNDSKDNSF